MKGKKINRRRLLPIGPSRYLNRLFYSTTFIASSFTIWQSVFIESRRCAKIYVRLYNTPGAIFSTIVKKGIMEAKVPPLRVCVARTNVNGIDIVRFLVISLYWLSAALQGPRDDRLSVVLALTRWP